MTDQTLEGGQDQASQGLPIPKLENDSAGSATSGVDTKAIALEVAKILKPDFERVAQSTKDKRIAALEKKFGTLAELEEMGATIPDSVKLEYRLREMEQARQPQTQPTSSGGTGDVLTAQDVSEVMAKFKLDANDPQVLEKLRGTYRNRDHFQAIMAEMVVSRVNQSTPTPAGLTQSAATGGARVTNLDALNAELTTLYKEPSKPGAMQRIAAIQKQIKEAG